MNRLVYLALLMWFFSCGPAPQIYYYTLDVTAPQKSRVVFPSVLWVKEFHAASIYNQDCMLYRVGPYEVKFDHYRRWTTHLNEMLRQQLVNYLRSAGVFERVQIYAPTKQPYYYLSGEILQFEEVVNKNGRTAKVRLWVELWRTDQPELVHSCLVSGEAVIPRGGGEAIAQAMSAALEMALAELVGQWNTLAKQ